MSDSSVLSKIYFDVPFARKEEASEIGLLWDQSSGKWFTETKATAKLARGKFERLKKPRFDRGPGRVSLSKLPGVSDDFYPAKGELPC